jgi:hypothetical protein
MVNNFKSNKGLIYVLGPFTTACFSTKKLHLMRVKQNKNILQSHYKYFFRNSYNNEQSSFF